MQTNRHNLRFARHMAMSLMATTSCFLLGQAGARAQTTATLAQTPPTAPRLLASADAPVSLVSSSDFAYSSSSSATTEAASVERFNLSGSADASQPPPRRRYGRPNYSDSHTNQDGSSKFAFMAGGGISLPVEDTKTYLNPNYAVQVGAGRNFNKMYGLIAQFDYDRFGFQGSTLNNQSVLYYGATGVGLDGTSHVWSFSLNPVVNFYGTGSTGMYAVGGVGFYHKTANFTVPSTGTYCDYYYGCYQYQANQTVDKYTSNAVGFNGGLGFTYKPSRFASERFYTEARFVYVANQPKSYTATNNNYYPPNSNQTYYVPITVGLRF